MAEHVLPFPAPNDPTADVRARLTAACAVELERLAGLDRAIALALLMAVQHGTRVQQLATLDALIDYVARTKLLR